MVKHANKPKSGKSKRKTLKVQYKIKRKVREHNKKVKKSVRQMQKLGKNIPKGMLYYDGIIFVYQGSIKIINYLTNTLEKNWR